MVRGSTFLDYTPNTITQKIFPVLIIPSCVRGSREEKCFCSIFMLRDCWLFVYTSSEWQIYDCHMFVSVSRDTHISDIRNWCFFTLVPSARYTSVMCLCQYSNNDQLESWFEIWLRMRLLATWMVLVILRWSTLACTIIHLPTESSL